MAFKIQFDNGHEVEFDIQPSDADIDEAYAHTQTLGAKKQNYISQIPAGPEADQYTEEPPRTPLDYVRGGLETAANVTTGAAAFPLGIITGLPRAAITGENADPAIGKQMQEFTYQPRGSVGQEWSHAVGEFVNRNLIPMVGFHGTLPPAMGTKDVVNSIKSRIPERTPQLKGPDLAGLTKELVTTKVESKEIPNLKATEGPDGQMALFDIPEEGRMPNPYEAVTGDWRIDENGMPIKADLSMDAANAAEPLQRNLWGDELAQKHPQENARSIPEAIDAIPDTPFKGDARDVAINRLKGAIEAPGELEAAKLEAESPFARVGRMKGQGGGVNVGEITKLWEAKDRDRAIESNSTDLKSLREDIARNGIKEPITITVSTVDGLGYVTDGNNRLTAAKQLGMKDIPYKVELSNVPFTESQRAKAKSTSELGLSKQDLIPKPKTKEAIEAENWLKEFNKSSYVPKSQRGGIRVDYSKRKEAGVLKGIPGLREKIGDIMPDTRTTEQFLKDEVKTSDVNQNFLQKGINYLTKGGIYQTIKTQNPLVKRVTERFLEADNSAKAQIADMVHDRLAPAARELSNTEKADVWAAQQIAEKAGKPLDAETMLKHGFNEKQVKWVEAHTEVMKVMYDKLSEAMKASGVKPVSPQVAYVASRATGDFRTLVHDTEGNVVGILGANTRAGLKRDIERLKAQNPDYVVGEERYFGKGSKKGGTAESFSQMLEFLSENDPKMKDFVKRVNDMLTEDAFNYMNAKSHTMYKKGVFGMEGRKPFADAVENARDGMQAQIQYAEKMIKWAEMSKAVEDIKPVLAKDNGLNMPNAKAWAEDYVQQALGNNPTETGRAIDAAFATLGKATGIGTTLPSRAVSAAKRVTNGLLLGFVNIGFLAANMLQPFKANPEMMAFLKGRGLEKGFDAGTGYTYFAKALDTMWKDEAGKALPEYKQGALDYAKKNHVYSSDLFEASNTANKGVGYYWDKATQFVAASVESVTRQMTFLSYVELLHENGLKKADGLYETAQRLTDMHMNNYSQIEAPKAYMAAGGVGKTAYNLMSYKHNELSRLAMLTSELGRSKTATPLLTHIAASVAFAGVMGTILYSEADWFVKQISKLTGKPTSLTKILLDNPQISDTFKYGFGSLGGVDLTNRLGLGPLTPGSGHAVDAIMPGASKIVNIAKTGTEAIKNHDEYSFKNFAREMLPNSVASIADRAWFSPKNAKGEEMSLNRNKVQVNATRNAADKLWKSIGMTGINEAKQKALDYENQQITKAYEDKRKDIVMNAAKAFFTSGKLPPDFGKAYIEAQGDPNSLEREATQIAMEQKVPMHTLQLIKNAMSQSITSTHKALRATGRE